MPPMVIAGGLAAIGTIGGALIGSHAQSSAANQAAQTQQQATAAQTQLGQQSLALNQGIYNSNYDLLNPFVSRGNAAGDQINALLGLPQAQPSVSPMAQPIAPAAPAPAQPAPFDLEALRHDGIPGDYAAAVGKHGGGGLGGILGALSPAAGILGIGGANTSLLKYASPALMAASALGGSNGGQNTAMGVQHAPVASQTPVPSAAPTPTAAAPNALSPTQALNNFANSAGMQFQLQQGENALQNNYADKGALQSGAAMKALQSYGQSTALNNYFMPYMGLLGGQQAVGAQAGSAVAGVGSNFGNTAANILGNMGSSIQNGADATSNAALVKGANTANLFGGIGSAIGNLGSSYFMSQGGGAAAPAASGFATTPGTTNYFASNPFGGQI